MAAQPVMSIAPPPASVLQAVRVLESVPIGPGQVHVTVEDGVFEIIIDNPRRSGAISPSMMVAFFSAVEQLRALEPALVLFRSTAPNAFCAGGDLGAVRAHLVESERAAAMTEVMTWCLDAISTGPAMVLAAVDGPALGGGAELLTACDHIFASKGAKVGFVHVSLGVTPGWGGLRRLVARVGRRSALRWLTFAAPLTAEEAMLWGMVDTLVETSAAEAARDEAFRLAAMPRHALRTAVSLVRRGGDGEAAAFLSLWGGPDHRAALRRVGAGR